MNKELKSDPLLIKNPFSVKSAVGVRVGVGKDPRFEKIGNVDFIEEWKKPNGNIEMVNTRNNKLTYTIGNNLEENIEYTSGSKMDYFVSAETLNAKSKNNIIHTDALPISFLQINNEIDGINWYRENYPKIPEELLPIIARYHWGEPITKKAVKNEKKKLKKKIQKLNGVQYKTGNFTIDFN